MACRSQEAVRTLQSIMQSAVFRGLRISWFAIEFIAIKVGVLCDIIMLLSVQALTSITSHVLYYIARSAFLIPAFIADQAPGRACLFNQCSSSSMLFFQFQVSVHLVASHALRQYFADSSRPRCPRHRANRRHVSCLPRVRAAQ